MKTIFFTHNIMKIFQISVCLPICYMPWIYSNLKRLGKFP